MATVQFNHRFQWDDPGHREFRETLLALLDELEQELNLQFSVRLSTYAPHCEGPEGLKVAWSAEVAWEGPKFVELHHIVCNSDVTVTDPGRNDPHSVLLTSEKQLRHLMLSKLIGRLYASRALNEKRLQCALALSADQEEELHFG